MHRLYIAIALTVALLAGCSEESSEESADDTTASATLTEEEYAQAVTFAACQLYGECDLLEYFGGTFAECVEEVQSATLAYVTSADCEFDAAAAADCIAEFEGATCDASTSTSTSTGSACNDVCGDVPGAD